MGFDVVRVPSEAEVGTEPILYQAAAIPDVSEGFVQSRLNELVFVQELGVAVSEMSADGAALSPAFAVTMVRDQPPEMLPE